MVDARFQLIPADVQCEAVVLGAVRFAVQVGAETVRGRVLFENHLSGENSGDGDGHIHGIPGIIPVPGPAHQGVPLQAVEIAVHVRRREHSDYIG